MFLTFILFIPYGVMVLLGLRSTMKRFVFVCVSAWARNIIWAAGGKVIVHGEENIPAEDRVCYIANHQGFGDILLVLGYAGKTVGFIAKKELSRIPLVNVWMAMIHCLYIDRKNIKQALKVMEKGVENIKAGNPMLIFPEGTRSKGGPMAAFKSGSFRLALRSRAIIVPLTIDNTYKLLEEKKRVHPATIYLTIHEPIDTALLSEDERNKLPDTVWNIIHAGLKRSEHEIARNH